MAKVIYKRECLIWGSWSTVLEFVIIMAGSMHEASRVLELQLRAHITVHKHKEEKALTGNGEAFVKPPTPFQGHASSNKATPLPLPTQFHQLGVKNSNL